MGSWEHLGLKIEYVIQPSPDGLAQAFILGEKFIGDDNVCLILGDNIFYGHGITKMLLQAREKVEKYNKSISLVKLFSIINIFII